MLVENVIPDRVPHEGDPSDVDRHDDAPENANEKNLNEPSIIIAGENVRIKSHVSPRRKNKK